MSWNGYEHDALLRNDGAADDGIPRFTNVAMALGSDNYGDGRGIGFADFDHDGDLDVIVNNGQGDSDIPERARPTLYRNDIGSRRAWLQVELVGTESNSDGIGAIVEVRAGGRTQIRHAHAGSAYASQHSGRLHFGLGAADTVESITVHWPSGAVDEHVDVTVNQGVRVTEGHGIEVDVLPRPSAPLGGVQ
jgi:hypothetical protein